MAEQKGRLLFISLGLLLLAFVVGLVITIFSKANYLVLDKFTVSWLILSSILLVGTWAPAILLVSSATNTETSAESTGFSTTALKSLAPGLILAGLISVYYLLLVPPIQAKKTWYEQSSALFLESLKQAQLAYDAKRYSEAESALHICGSIDNKNETYLTLTEKVQSGLAHESSNTVVGEENPTGSPTGLSNQRWKEGNQFYLDALQARKDRRLFDAHYLAKRSSAIYPNRPEVQRLISETWTELQSSGPSQEELDAATLYRRKLEGYGYFEAEDYVRAYQAFSELAKEHPQDEDIVSYRKRSEDSLSKVAFYIEEEIRAFSGSSPKPFVLRTTKDGVAMVLRARQAAYSPDGVFFRDLDLELTGPSSRHVLAPYARLHGTTLLLKAVDRKDPSKVWTPVWVSGGKKPIESIIMNLPSTTDDIRLLIEMARKPEDVPLMYLATSIERAVALGLDPLPLRVELASRIAYPFITIMVVLFGAALGMRFKARTAPGLLGKMMGGPILTICALVPMSLFTHIGSLLATLLAIHTSGILFMVAWSGVLGACVVVVLLFSARASMHAPLG